LSEGLVNLRAPGAVTKTVEEFTGALKVRVGFVEALEAQEEVAVIVLGR